MQQETHLARLVRCTAIPLTLLAQWTGTTTANAGAIHHSQAAIRFPERVRVVDAGGSREQVAARVREAVGV